MTAHELARELLKLPDVGIFVQEFHGHTLTGIHGVELCGCEGEAFIVQEDDWGDAEAWDEREEE